MTLLDLIRKLHSQGKPVLDYDLFVCDNSAMDMENVVDQTPGYECATPVFSPDIPPQYIELGDKPRFLYAESVSDFRKLVNTTKTLPKLFPRLLVGVFSDQSAGFFPRYKGRSWHEIPPLELFWLSQDGLLLPALDAAGRLTGAVYDNEIGVGEAATFYTVQSECGSEFAWQGDITRDPLPDGLRIVT